MKTSRFALLLFIPLLFSCIPRQPEIPMTEAPAEPIVRALEARARSFSSLRAFAALQISRKDRKRSFDNVGILLRGQERFRMEAYGPLGETVVTLVWNGKEILADMSGQRRILPPGNSGLERILGADVDPGELCAILSGNVPGTIAGYQARLFCGPNNLCVLELRNGDRLVKVRPAAGWESAEAAALQSWEMFRNGKMVYRVLYFTEPGSGYPVPKRLRVENPDKRMSLTLEYTEIEKNVTLSDAVFSIHGMENE